MRHWLQHRAMKLCRFWCLSIVFPQFCLPLTPGRRFSTLTSTLKYGPYSFASSLHTWLPFRCSGNFNWSTSTIICSMWQALSTTGNGPLHASQAFRSLARALSFQWSDVSSPSSNSFFGGFYTSISGWGTTLKANLLSVRKKNGSFCTTLCQLSWPARSTPRSCTASWSVSHAAPPKKPLKMSGRAGIGVPVESSRSWPGFPTLVTSTK